MMEIYKKIEEEVMEANDYLIDTILHVSKEKKEEEAAAESKDIVIVTFTYRGICVEDSLKAELELSKMVPLQLFVPPDYPEKPPIIRPESLPENSHQIDLAAREKLKARQSPSQPLTIVGLGKLWDQCCRDAVTDVAMKYGGGTFSSNIGVWQSSELYPPWRPDYC